MNTKQHRQTDKIRMICAIILSGYLIASCGNPLSVETDRSIIPVNIDSILLSDPFLEKTTDTLFANVDGRPVNFTSELIRPIFYNRNISNAWYVSVQGMAYDLAQNTNEILALRMDEIRSPGVYPIADPYTLPKRVDPTLSSQYGGRYIQRKGTVKEEFVTSRNNQQGEIRVLAIDTERGVLVGRFHFTAYDPASGDTIRIEDGVFRLHLETY